jgi:hypothetical protein
VAVKSELSSKSDGAVDCIFLAIVNIVDLETHCLVAGEGAHTQMGSCDGGCVCVRTWRHCLVAGEGAHTQMGSCDGGCVCVRTWRHCLVAGEAATTQVAAVILELPFLGVGWVRARACPTYFPHAHFLLPPL